MYKKLCIGISVALLSGGLHAMEDQEDGWVSVDRDPAKLLQEIVQDAQSKKEWEHVGNDTQITAGPSLLASVIITIHPLSVSAPTEAAATPTPALNQQSSPQPPFYPAIESRMVSQYFAQQDTESDANNRDSQISDSHNSSYNTDDVDDMPVVCAAYLNTLFWMFASSSDGNSAQNK